MFSTGRGVDGAGGGGGGGDHSGAGHHGGARGWLLAGARPHGFGGHRPSEYLVFTELMVLLLRTLR